MAKFELKLEDYRKFGLLENPVKSITDYKIELIGNDRIEKRNSIVYDIASAAIGGYQNILYLSGDWGVGKSILIANVTSLVNEVLFEKPIVDSLPRGKDQIKITFSRCIGIFLETPTEKPNNWIFRSVSNDTFGFGITNGNSIKSLRKLALILYKMGLDSGIELQRPKEMTDFLTPEIELPTDEIDELMVSIETIDPNTRSKMVGLIDAFVKNQLRVGISGKKIEIESDKARKIVSALEESFKSTYDIEKIEKSFFKITLKDMAEFMKIANCFLFVAIDQLEQKYDEKVLNTILKTLKSEDNVYIVLIDQLDRLSISKPRTKADNVLESIVKLGSIEKLEKMTELDLRELLEKRLEGVRTSPSLTPYHPFEEEAVMNLIKKSGRIPRAFLHLLREVLKEASRDDSITEISNALLDEEPYSNIIEKVVQEYLSKKERHSGPISAEDLAKYLSSQEKGESD